MLGILYAADEQRRHWALTPELQTFLDARQRSAQCDAIGQIVGHRAHRSLPVTGHEELLHLLRLVTETHASDDIEMKVLILCAHAADEDRECPLPHRQRPSTSSFT